MSSTLMTKVEEGEFWWGGAVHDGAKMPLSAHSVYAIDLRREGRGNQSAPFFVSSHGRTVWSEEPFAISFDHGILRAEGSAPILPGTARRNAAGRVSRRHEGAFSL